jgi:hypothetical protein
LVQSDDLNRKRPLKEDLVKALDRSRSIPSKEELVKALDLAMVPIESEDAALEKAKAGENRAVEHIAELAPFQAEEARKRHKRTTAPHTPPQKTRRMKRDTPRRGRGEF